MNTTTLTTAHVRRELSPIAIWRSIIIGCLIFWAGVLALVTAMAPWLQQVLAKVTVVGIGIALAISLVSVVASWFWRGAIPQR